MLKVKNRFKTESGVEKLHGMFYILIWISMPVIAYFSFLHFQEMNKYCFIGLGLYALFILTTLSGLVDYKNVKDAHSNTYEKYKASINPSRGSFLYRDAKDAHDERVKANKSTEDMTLCAFILTIAVISAIIALIYGFCTDNYYPFALTSFNLFLVLFSFFFAGEVINDIEVNHLQLEEINDVTDLSTIEKNTFKHFLKNKLDKDKKITRGHMYTIFKELDAMKKEREISEALKSVLEKENDDKKRSRTVNPGDWTHGSM